MARTGFERARRAVSAVAFVAFVAIALLNNPPGRASVHEMMEVAGLGLLICATIGRIWAALYLTGRKSKVLCMAGPFSLSRNPLYLFSFVGALGLGLLTGSFILLALLVATFLGYYHFVINNEEKRLAEIFGPDFDEYKRRVPRLFPWKPRQYETIEELSVKTKPFMQAVLDTSMLLWAFFAFEVTEALTAVYGWQLPVVFHLP